MLSFDSKVLTTQGLLIYVFHYVYQETNERPSHINTSSEMLTLGLDAHM